MPGLRCHAIATVLALVLGACAAPNQQAGNSDAAPQAQATAPQTPAVKPAKPPRMSDPLPPQRPVFNRSVTLRDTWANAK